MIIYKLFLRGEYSCGARNVAEKLSRIHASCAAILPRRIFPLRFTDAEAAMFRF